MYNPEFDKNKSQVKPAPYADAAVNDEELTSPQNKNDLPDADENSAEDLDDDLDIDEDDDFSDDVEPGEDAVEEIEFEEVEIDDVGDLDADTDFEDEDEDEEDI